MLIQEEHDIEQLQERERAVRQLESDILDVNTIFKDLATLVHDQGEVIDSIEANVESTQVRVQEGTEQLRQAETYKNKARKKKFILGIILLIVLAIIIGIIAWQSN
jgi:t-SNARE complex subunit (syntaxin)